MGLVRDTDDVDVDDLAPAWPIHNVDNPDEERLLVVAGHDEQAGHHPVGFGGSVEEGPDVARLVHLSDVGGQCDAHGWLVGDRCLLTSSRRSSPDRPERRVRDRDGVASHLVEPIGHTARLTGHQVAVPVERERRRGVTEHPLEDFTSAPAAMASEAQV